MTRFIGARNTVYGREAYLMGFVPVKGGFAEIYERHVNGKYVSSEYTGRTFRTYRQAADATWAVNSEAVFD